MVDIKQRDRSEQDYLHGQRQDREIKVHGDKLLSERSSGRREENLDRLSMLDQLHKGERDTIKKHGDELSPVSPASHKQLRKQHFNKPVYVADYDLDQDTSVCFLGLFDKEYDHQGNPVLSCRPKEAL